MLRACMPNRREIFNGINHDVAESSYPNFVQFAEDFWMAQIIPSCKQKNLQNATWMWDTIFFLPLLYW